MTRDRILAGLKVLEALRDTVYESEPHGAPLGPMFAACNASGMSYETFMQGMQLLVDAKCITISNNVAHKRQK